MVQKILASCSKAHLEREDATPNHVAERLQSSFRLIMKQNRPYWDILMQLESAACRQYNRRLLDVFRTRDELDTMFSLQHTSDMFGLGNLYTHLCGEEGHLCFDYFCVYQECSFVRKLIKELQPDLQEAQALGVPGTTEAADSSYLAWSVFAVMLGWRDMHRKVKKPQTACPVRGKTAWVIERYLDERVGAHELFRYVRESSACEPFVDDAHGPAMVTDAQPVGPHLPESLGPERLVLHQQYIKQVMKGELSSLPPGILRMYKNVAVRGGREIAIPLGRIPGSQPSQTDLQAMIQRGDTSTLAGSKADAASRV